MSARLLQLLDYANDLLRILAGTLLGLILSPSSRSFWLFLVPSLIAAAWLLRRETFRGENLPSQLRVFSEETWLSRSAINDYAIIAINTTLGFVVLDKIGVSFETIRSFVLGVLEQIAPRFEAPSSWWTPILLSLVIFIVDDFGRYIVHYLEHKLPPL